MPESPRTPDTRQRSKEEMARSIMQTMEDNEREDRADRPERPRRRPSDPSQRQQRPVHKNGAKKASTSAKKGSKKKKKSAAPLKAIIITVLIIVGLVVALLAFLYFRGMRESQGKFLKNTKINGVSVDGCTEEEAYSALMASSPIPKAITILKLDGSKTEIPLSDIGYQNNVRTTIAQYMSQQNYYMWFKGSNKDYRFETLFTYDRTLLRAELKNRVVNNSGKVEPRDAYIKYSDGMFTIEREHKGDKIDDSKLDDLIEFVEEKLKLGIYEIDLETCDLYQSPKIVAADLKDELSKLEGLSDVIISIDFDYETASLTGSEFMSWITFKDGNALAGMTVDRKKAMQYVEKLAAKYDSFNKPRKFNSTTRGEIVVEQGEGCYGWWIDQEKMCDYIVSLIEKAEDADVKPIYYKNPYSGYEYVCDPKLRTADKDFGDTYCEVDLAKQHFWYYENGEMKYESDIVSGKPTEARNTPGGVYRLWLKEKNKVLSGTNSAGESWRTPVTFWNNISTFGVGLHDASWQAAFGGERYKWYGSQGCINMPYKAAEYVYENVPIGTPVFMYW